MPEPPEDQASAPEGTPAPEPSAPPEPSGAPEPSDAPEPSGAPEPSAVPEPSAAPEPSPAPEPSGAPEPSAVPEPSAAPEPSGVPEPSAAPEPSGVPEPDPAAEPVPDSAAAGEEAAAAAEAAAEAPPPEPPGPPPLSEEAQALLDRLEAELGQDLIEHGQAFGDLVVRVTPAAWRRAAEVSRAKLACDYLSFIAGIDWAPAPRAGGEEAGGDTSAPVQPTEMTFGVAGSTGRFQVLARVSSTTRHWGVTFKLDVDESDPRVPSWVSVYPGADWHERECWEMFGINFDGHPAMRHLYLPAEFEGHPLRKDFPLLAREVKPWPGLVDVEPMPGEEGAAEEAAAEGGGE